MLLMLQLDTNALSSIKLKFPNLQNNCFDKLIIGGRLWHSAVDDSLHQCFLSCLLNIIII